MNRRNPFKIRPVEFSGERARGSLTLRALDAGSCGDCELEIVALGNPQYDFERFGFHLTASPRHADVLLISGPFTRSMESAALAAFEAMPEPRRVVTLGDGLAEDSPFRASYAVIPLPDVLRQACVLHIPGDPPAPAELLAGLLSLLHPPARKK